MKIFRANLSLVLFMTLSACSAQPQQEQETEGDGVQTFFDNVYAVQEAQGFKNSLKAYRGLTLLANKLVPAEWWIGSLAIDYDESTGDFKKGGYVYKYISDSPDGRRYAFYRFISQKDLELGKTMENDGKYTMVALEHNPYIIGPLLFRYNSPVINFDIGKTVLHENRLPKMIWDNEAAFIGYYTKLSSYTAIEAFPSLGSYQNFIDNFAMEGWNEQRVIGTAVER